MRFFQVWFQKGGNLCFSGLKIEPNQHRINYWLTLLLHFKVGNGLKLFLMEQFWAIAFSWDIPYVPPSSLHFQIGIWSPKQHFFDWEFCMGLPHTLCKQWAKGFLQNFKFLTPAQCAAKRCGILEGVIYLLFGPHSLITCFLGHTNHKQRKSGSMQEIAENFLLFC